MSYLESFSIPESSGDIQQGVDDEHRIPGSEETVWLRLRHLPWHWHSHGGRPQPRQLQWIPTSSFRHFTRQMAVHVSVDWFHSKDGGTSEFRLFLRVWQPWQNSHCFTTEQTTNRQLNNSEWDRRSRSEGRSRRLAMTCKTCLRQGSGSPSTIYGWSSLFSNLFIFIQNQD